MYPGEMTDQPLSNITNMPHQESSSLRLEDEPPVLAREGALSTSRGQQEQNNHLTSNTTTNSVNNDATAKGYLQQRQRLRKIQREHESPMTGTENKNESHYPSRTKLVRSDSNSSMDVSLSSLESSASSIRRRRMPIVGSWNSSSDDTSYHSDNDDNDDDDDNDEERSYTGSVGQMIRGLDRTMADLKALKVDFNDVESLATRSDDEESILLPEKDKHFVSTHNPKSDIRTTTSAHSDPLSPISIEEPIHTIHRDVSSSSSPAITLRTSILPVMSSYEDDAVSLPASRRADTILACTMFLLFVCAYAYWMSSIQQVTGPTILTIAGITVLYFVSTAHHTPMTKNERHLFRWNYYDTVRKTTLLLIYMLVWTFLCHHVVGPSLWTEQVTTLSTTVTESEGDVSLKHASIESYAVDRGEGSRITLPHMTDTDLFRNGAKGNSICNNKEEEDMCQCTCSKPPPDVESKREVEDPIMNAHSFVLGSHDTAITEPLVATTITTKADSEISDSVATSSLAEIMTLDNPISAENQVKIRIRAAERYTQLVSDEVIVETIESEIEDLQEKNEKLVSVLNEDSDFSEVTDTIEPSEVEPINSKSVLFEIHDTSMVDLVATITTNDISEISDNVAASSSLEETTTKDNAISAENFKNGDRAAESYTQITSDEGIVETIQPEDNLEVEDSQDKNEEQGSELNEDSDFWAVADTVEPQSMTSSLVETTTNAISAENQVNIGDRARERYTQMTSDERIVETIEPEDNLEVEDLQDRSEDLVSKLTEQSDFSVVTDTIEPELTTSSPVETTMKDNVISAIIQDKSGDMLAEKYNQLTSDEYIVEKIESEDDFEAKDTEDKSEEVGSNLNEDSDLSGGADTVEEQSTTSSVVETTITDSAIFAEKRVRSGDKTAERDSQMMTSDEGIFEMIESEDYLKVEEPQDKSEEVDCNMNEDSDFSGFTDTAESQSATSSAFVATTLDNAISAENQVNMGDRAAERYSEMTSDKGILETIESEEYLEVEASEVKNDELVSRFSDGSDLLGVTDMVEIKATISSLVKNTKIYNAISAENEVRIGDRLVERYIQITSDEGTVELDEFLEVEDSQDRSEELLSKFIEHSDISAVTDTLAPESTTISFVNTKTTDNVLSAVNQVKSGDSAVERYTQLSSDEGIAEKIESKEYLEVEDSEKKSEEPVSNLTEQSDFLGVTDVSGVIKDTVKPESTAISFVKIKTTDNVLSAENQVRSGDRAAERYTELSSDEGIVEKVESKEYSKVEDSEKKSEEPVAKLTRQSDFSVVTDMIEEESAKTPSQLVDVTIDTRSLHQREAWPSNETNPSALQTERSKEKIVEKAQFENIDMLDELYEKKETIKSLELVRDFDVVSAVANDTQKNKMGQSNISSKMAAPFTPLTLRIKHTKRRLVESMKSAFVSTLSKSSVDENSRYIDHINVKAGVLSAFTTMKVQGITRLNEIALTTIRLSAIVRKRSYYALQTFYRFLFAMSDKNAETLEMLWDLWM